MSNIIKNVEDFIKWTNQLDGQMLLYRGLAKSNWEIESSAYRRIKKSLKGEPKRVNRITVQEYHKQLLENVRSRYKHGRRLNDLDLLADLQHYGAATCLIDFTENSLIALWFACREKPTKHGKVVAMDTDNPRLFSTVGSEDRVEPIENLLNEKDTIWKWHPSNQNNRIISQQSVFVFGDNVLYEFIEYHHNVLIDKDSKKDILESLKKSFGVKEENLFNDLPGFALCNAHDKKYDVYTAEDYFRLGLTFQQERKYKKAINYYDNALELDPQYVWAYYNRGNAKHALGDHKDAIADYDKAIEINPEHAALYYNRGISKKALGDHQGAILDYSKALELDPQYVWAYQNRGFSRNELGDHQGAIRDYDKAIEINPEYVNAYINRGLSKSKLGDHQGAMADCNKALEINPQNAVAYHNRGHAKYALGDLAGAKKDWDKARAIEPKMQPPES